MTIKFSGDYPKLHGQTSAQLLAVRRIKINKQTPQELLEYDTKKSDGSYYKLQSGAYLQLIFVGNLDIPFSTIRAAYPPEKEVYYRAAVGKTFNIEIYNQPLKT